MKKILVVFAVLLIACTAVFANPGVERNNKVNKVAMITDSGDITDQSFNQTTWEAVQAFGTDHKIEFNYYKPTGDSDAARITQIEKAIDDGYNYIVTPGYLFAPAIKATAEKNPDVKFITLDIGTGDWGDYKLPKNIYAAVYAEQYCGYMAGYAAVKLGYTKLGFLGGMAVPAVVRYGYGFVQGADEAAKELGIRIDLKYVYGGQFFGDVDITAVMDSWYASGTQVVFACGGGIYTSAGEAAQKYKGKIIGVDVDQSGIIDAAYGKGITITSAMKGLRPTTYNTLVETVINGKWDNYGGKLETLGLVSTNVEDNYVQIPTASTQFGKGFGLDDYKTLVGKLLNGTLKVTDDSVEPKVTNTRWDKQGSIK